MKHLLYYELDSKFVTDQIAAGGDGTSVVTIPEGVAWTKDLGNTYYDRGGIRRLTSITLPKGAYLFSDATVQSSDTIYFKFSTNSDWMVYFSSEFTATSGRVLFYGNQYNETIFCTSRNNSSVSPIISKKNVISTNDNIVYELVLPLSSRTTSDFKLNESSSWVDTGRSNLDQLPTYTSLPLCFNAKNVNGNPTIGSNTGNYALTIYKFMVTDKDGTIRHNIVPVLVGSSPKFLNETTDTLLDIGILQGYNPNITYSI